VKSTVIVVAICGCLMATARASDTAKPVSKPQPVTQTLDQMPAVPPQVSFQNGQLTITAQNCTLGDILKAVHAQTGAQVELPGNAGDRVIGNFGPGPARDVLAALLNGSHFNYVLLGSESNPQALDRVILTAKTGGATGSSAPVQEASTDSYQGNNNLAPQPFNPMMRPMPGRPGMPPNGMAQNPNPNQADAQADDSSDDSSDDSADDSTDADSADDADQADDQQGQETTVEGQAATPDQNGVKTPEQLLQELQQQQQQQQNGGVPQPGTQPPGLPPRVVGPGGMVPPH
jgi:hypothetical protein